MQTAGTPQGKVTVKGDVVNQEVICEGGTSQTRVRADMVHQEGKRKSQGKDVIHQEDNCHIEEEDLAQQENKSHGEEENMFHKDSEVSHSHLSHIHPKQFLAPGLELHCDPFQLGHSNIRCIPRPQMKCLGPH